MRNPNTSSWREHAACLDEDPNLFFPDGERGHAPMNQMELAREVCKRCPVRLDCLEGAFVQNITDGMWGGTTPEERRSIKRRGVVTTLTLDDIDRIVATSRPEPEPVIVVARPLSYEQRMALEQIEPLAEAVRA